MKGEYQGMIQLADSRKVLGVFAGLATAAAVFWFTPDVVEMVGGRMRDRTAITTLAVMALMLSAGFQVGSLVGWGTQFQDSTWPAWLTWAIIVGSAIVIFASVPYRS